MNTCSFIAIFAALLHTRTPAPDWPAFQRPVSTYSIVARDPATGEIGVAVQSHWFSVGSVVPWAEAGVGAVATQSMVDPAYGPLGLEMMRLGRSAPDALASILAGDSGRALRQVAMIDAAGRVAAHTGEKCIRPAGHSVDTGLQFSVQANLMANDRVWPAMAAAFKSARGDLADRMIAALEAAEAEGGDIRGRQSAALVVVAAHPTGKTWIDRRFDLRVEDHPHPVAELKRLVQLQRAYLHMNAGDLAMEKKDFAAAQREYESARACAPHIIEIPFWHAVSLAGAGRLDDALPLFKDVFTREPVWAELIPRLVAAGLLPTDPSVAARILDQAAGAKRAP
ncbi:MAG: Zn-dependent protease [Planctomycetota bacterium]|nr:MAG: Zn-dependent protease [Planctomycetota bacterium]